MAEVKRVWLIRHAESTSNVGEPTSHPETIPLTARGRAQSQYVAQYFAAPPALVVTSPFLRACETAEPLLERFPGVKQEVWPVQEFTYLAPDNCRLKTVADRRPQVEAYWKRCDPQYCDGTGAESFADFIARVQMTLERLRSIDAPFTVIFTHGQFIRAMAWLLLNGHTEINARTMQSYHQFLTAVVMPNGALIKVLIPEQTDEIYVSNLVTSHLPDVE